MSRNAKRFRALAITLIAIVLTNVAISYASLAPEHINPRPIIGDAPVHAVK
jgi:hypothetical protein